MTRIYDRFQHWHVTADERAATYPAEKYAPASSQRFLRGITVEADPATAFRWLCQLRGAPYSYDLLDNFGRSSPKTLTPGLDRLEIGQRFLIARIVEFEADRHITGVSTPAATAIFGRIALTYQVDAHGPRSSRLVVCMTVQAQGVVSRLRRSALGVGDLVMMRKQLMTLKDLAEHT